MAKDALPRKSPLPVPRISRRFLNRLFAHGADGYLLVDLEGRFADVNPALETILGRRKGELIGRNAFDPELRLFAPQSSRRVAETLAELVRSPVTPPRDFAVLRPNGLEIVLETSGTAIMVGSRRMAFLVQRDVTEQRRVVQRLQAQLAQIARLSMVGQMAAGMAHEINQTISVVFNFAKACELQLRQTNPNLDRLSEWSREITKAASHAVEIVHRVRGIERITPFRPESTRIGQLVEQSIVLVQTEWPVRPIEIHWDSEASELLVDVDRIQMVQVLVNLLRNAIDAIGQTAMPPGRITIQARPMGPLVEVAVLDNGPGLPKDLAHRVFEPFVSNKPAGLGIGLTLSRSIVEAHGGRLWADEPVEGGAAFRFTLPLAPAGPHVIQPPTLSEGAGIAPHFPVAERLTNITGEGRSF